MIFMDGLLDGKIKQGDDHAALIPIAISICQEESIKLLTHIFGLRSNFWNYWNLRRKEYLQAFQMEKMLSKDSRHFSIDFYENIAEKKAAMGKVAIDALHVLDREKNVETYQALLAGHEMFSIGLQLSDDFQRAILLDILCDLQEKTPQGNLLLPMINAEVAYLYASKLSRGVGGWSYFPTVKEIAPDADDLGQVLQCFARANRKDIIEEHCISLLETLFTDNYLENCGAFETWIIPRGNRSELEELQNYFNTTKWGKGPDPEVVANLLFGTVTAGLNQYAELVSNGIKYLLEEQAPQGFWKSRWYYGSYYGTYICLRLFQATKTASSAAGKALDWLLNTQNEDGGWGNTPGISTPLCTAFALLCFSTHPETMHAPIVAKGTEYLIRSGLEYGGIYPAEPFIIPKEGQPYKSKTITTAYVLKALISTMKITN